MALAMDIIDGRGFTNEARCVLLISKEEQGNALHIAVHFTVKAILPVVHY